VLSINSLNTGLGDLLDTSRNESDVVLNEGFEVARTGGEAAAADSEGRDEGLGDLGTGGKLGLHWKSGRGRWEEEEAMLCEERRRQRGGGEGGVRVRSLSGEGVKCDRWIEGRWRKERGGEWRGKSARVDEIAKERDDNALRSLNGDTVNAVELSAGIQWSLVSFVSHKDKRK
jgi:hypothetical protein